MPYTWTEPDVFLEYKDTEVYYAYKEFGDSVLMYHYGLSGTEDPELEFDVRSLESVVGSNFRLPESNDIREHHRNVIKCGIDFAMEHGRSFQDWLSANNLFGT